jgi:hypothetical protein
MASTERGGFFSRLVRRHDAIPVPTTIPAVTPSMPTEEERAAEKTGNIASRMRIIIQRSIEPLGESFPSGMKFKNLIFFETGRRFDDGHGEAGQTIATIDREGKIHMLKATGQGEHEEWDLDSAQSRSATDKEIIEFALPLMTIVRDRLGHKREKSTFQDRKANLPHDDSKTRILSRHKIEVELAIQKLLLLKFEHQIANPTTQ